MRETTVTLAGMASDLRDNRVTDLRDQRQAFVESLRARDGVFPLGPYIVGDAKVVVDISTLLL